MKTELETISINGVEYVRKDSIAEPAPNGNRAVVVVDRGWVFAGDVTRENGRVRLSRAVWLFSWKSVGLDGVIKDPSSKNADIRRIPDVDLPSGAEIFSIPVGPDWGIK